MACGNKSSNQPALAFATGRPGKPEDLTQAYEGDGVQVNSGQFDGLSNQEATEV